MAAHETPTERISAGDVAASSLRLSGKEREALRLLVNERRVNLKIKLERYEPKKKKRHRKAKTVHELGNTSDPMR